MELDVARKMIACMTPPVRRNGGNDVCASRKGKAFSTYDKEVRGFLYECSDDFRPDRVPAVQWDANLLYKYLYHNKWEPDCVFPRIVCIVSCTPRFGSNCDFGVVFEHPVSKAVVQLDMCRAFALVCREYRLAALAFESLSL